MSDWTLVYESYQPEQEKLREAILTLGNGYFATRGAAPESTADDVHYPATYLAGGYDRARTEIAGRIVENEDLVNLPNWLRLSFRPEDGEWFDLATTELLGYRQELDLRRGLLVRTVRFRDRRGRITVTTHRRIVHMADPHLAACETVFSPENWSGRIECVAALDGHVTNDGVARYGALGKQHLLPLAAEPIGDACLYLKSQTAQSELRIAECLRIGLFRGGEKLAPARALEARPDYVAHRFSLEVAPASPARVETVLALYTSRDRAIAECGLEARAAAARAPGFAELLASHELAWAGLWRRFDIDARLRATAERGSAELILRLHVFHLLQTVSPHVMHLDVGVPARGLHGEAYRGHVFWDELFIFPLLNLRVPEITRSLLMYRYRRLDAARRAAKAAGLRGAMFPWQSGSDGRDETQRLHLNPRAGTWIPDHSSLQRHVNAAIAYNVWQYFQATRDVEFLSFYGAEMLLAIARFWASAATYDPALGRYQLRGVVGPDEYHDAYPWKDGPGLDDNAYTNLMAAWTLQRAMEVLDFLPEERRRDLTEMRDLGREELAYLRDVGHRLRVPFHRDERGGTIISQFDGYERLEELDWARYRERYGNIERLDRILGAEGDTPNRYKASKQADVLMLFYLFSTEELAALFWQLGYSFDPECIPRNITYYLQRTSHGSSLSRIVHAWVLARSDREGSFGLFENALRTDLGDEPLGTTSEGIHLGAMAGTVDLIQRCYTGVELRRGVLWLNPSLPAQVEGLRLHLHYRKTSLVLDVERHQFTVAIEGRGVPPIYIGVAGQIHEMRDGDVRAFPLEDQPQQPGRLP